jgi:DNA-binding NtrC family response regulator
MPRTKHILVVDDEPCVRDICVQFLSMEGYEVDARSSGEEALEAVSHRSYDLLILDLCMKGMSGLTTFRHVKSMIPNAKAVVVSGSLDRYESELADAQRDGLLGVLSKPFALQELSTLVESAFDGRTLAALAAPTGINALSQKEVPQFLRSCLRT